MSSAAWGCIILGLVTIFTSILGIILDCKRTSPLMGRDRSQCGGFYAVLMLVGILFAVVGGLLFGRSRRYSPLGPVLNRMRV